MIDHIIRNHRPRVIRYIASLLNTPDCIEDAADACSVAELIAYKKFSEKLEVIDNYESEFISFLYGCARYVVREMNNRHFRHQRLLQENIIDIKQSLFHDDLRNFDSAELIEVILSIVGKYLTERDQSIIELHYKSGYKFNEIAEKLNITPANVRKIHERTLKRIREILNRFWRPDGPGSGCAAIMNATDKSGSRAAFKRNSLLPKTEKTDCLFKKELARYMLIKLLQDYGKFCNAKKATMFESKLNALFNTRPITSLIYSLKEDAKLSILLNEQTKNNTNNLLNKSNSAYMISEINLAEIYISYIFFIIDDYDVLVLN